MQLFIDAVGSHCFGAFWNGWWLCGRWLEQHQQNLFLIAWKELYAAIIAAATWASKWTGKRLLFHCDNQAVVDTWHDPTGKDKHLMQLVHLLYFIAAKGNFTVLVLHIHGVNNALAYALSHALSRGQVQEVQGLSPAGRIETNTGTTLLGITLDHDIW